MKHWEKRRVEFNEHRKDSRTNYERDFARVVHSAAFRRLQAKTQVLGMGDSDFYRTRLTHSMEVSQIGVAITKKLYRSSKEGSGERAILPPPMLMSTICLAHDLGHPPFGHGGEVALNRCMLPYGGFEGNGQTLRIATKLEPYVIIEGKPFGMNLTRRAVLGLIKYPAQYKDVVDWNLYPDGKPKPPSEELNGKAYDVQLESSSIFVAKKYKPPKCYLNEEHFDVVMDWVAKDLRDDWSKLSKVEKSKENKHPKTEHKSLDTSIMELAGTNIPQYVYLGPELSINKGYEAYLWNSRISSTREDYSKGAWIQVDNSSIKSAYGASYFYSIHYAKLIRQLMVKKKHD